MITRKPDKGPPMRQSASFRADLACNSAAVSRPPPLPDLPTVDYAKRFDNAADDIAKE
jgi:hypothetical protein